MVRDKYSRTIKRAFCFFMACCIYLGAMQPVFAGNITIRDINIKNNKINVSTVYEGEQITGEGLWNTILIWKKTEAGSWKMDRIWQSVREGTEHIFSFYTNEEQTVAYQVYVGGSDVDSADWQLKEQPFQIEPYIVRLEQTEIIEEVLQGEEYVMPNPFKAIMSDGSIQDVELSWNPSVIDTDVPGIYEAIGTYQEDEYTTFKVDLKLSVLPKPIVPSITNLQALCINGNVNITGKISTGQDKTVSITVKDPNGRTCYTNQTSSLENGNFSFNFVLSQGSSTAGDYQVEVTGEEVETPRTTTFYFANSAEIEAAITAVNDASGIMGMKNVIKNYYKALSLQSLGLTFEQYDDKIFDILIYTRDQINKRKYKDIQEIYNAVSDALLVMKIRNATEDTVINILQQNRHATGIDITNPNNDYNKLGDTEDAPPKVLFRQAFIEKINEDDCKSLPEIKLAFREELIVSLINCISDPKDISSILIGYNDILRLNDVIYYSTSLDDIQQAQVNNAIILANIKDIDDVRNVFQSEIDKIRKARNGKGSGSGQGTGGRTSGSMTTFTAGIIPQETEIRTLVFKDIPGGHWAEESIKELSSKGIIQGFGNGEFRPDDSVTREQFVKMLIAGFGLLDEKAVCSFNDVLMNDWYYPYIASAQKLGIINGAEDGSFGVGREITRQEMAAMTYRVISYIGIKLPVVTDTAVFEDTHEIADYALQSIKTMQQAGILKGVGENRFAPNGTTTRAAAAKVLHELIKLHK